METKKLIGEGLGGDAELERAVEGRAETGQRDARTGAQLGIAAGRAVLDRPLPE